MADATVVRRWPDFPLYGVVREQMRGVPVPTIHRYVGECLDKIGGAAAPAGDSAYVLWWEIRLEALTDELIDRWEAAFIRRKARRAGRS